MGIRNALLALEGDDLFSYEEICFPVSDIKPDKTRWRPDELATCSYLRHRVHHYVATRPDYKLAYLCELVKMLDAQE